MQQKVAPELGQRYLAFWLATSRTAPVTLTQNTFATTLGCQTVPTSIRISRQRRAIVPYKPGELKRSSKEVPVNARLLLITIPLCSGCWSSTDTKDTIPADAVSITESQAVEIVRKHLGDSDDETANYKIDAMRFNGKWNVTAWQITGRKDGVPQFMPGGFTDFDLSDSGKIEGYTFGH